MEKLWKVTRVSLTYAGRQFGSAFTSFPFRVEGTYLPAAGLPRRPGDETFTWIIGPFLPEDLSQFDLSEADLSDIPAGF